MINLKNTLIFCFWLWLISLIFPFGTDSTDKDFWHKSNLILHIDNRTGCHYLSTWTGNLIPRLDNEGNHICTGYAKE